MSDHATMGVEGRNEQERKEEESFITPYVLNPLRKYE